MSVIMLARRRQAEDLQALLDGGRASSPGAASELAPLAALATALAPSDVRPRDEFRAALRGRLLTEAAAREPAPRALVTVDRERRSTGHRVRQAVAAVAVTSVVVGAGAAAASTRALPGDALYGLKRQVENVQLSLTHGDIGRGRELLEQADTRLGEAGSLAAGEDSTAPETRARLAGALADMDTAVAAAADDLTRAYRETGDEQPLLLLSRSVAEQQDRLADLLPLLDPELRAEVRALQAGLAELDQQTSAVLGLAPAGTGTESPGATSSTLDRTTPGDPGGAPGSGTSAGSTADGTAGGTAGGSAGEPAGGSGASGTTSGGGLLGGNATSASSAPLPSDPVSAVTSAVPLPLPTSTPLVTDPVAVVTSAVPLPTSSTLPSVSLCVPVPPLTAC